MHIDELRGATLAYNAGGLSLDNGATTYDIANAVNYSIGGRAYQKATVANGATPTQDALTGKAFNPLGPNEICTLVWLVDATGDLKVAQGPVVPVQDDGREECATELPEPPADHCPIAFSRHKSDDTVVAWIPGSDNWNASGMSDVVVDCATLPKRPPADAVA